MREGVGDVGWSKTLPRSMRLVYLDQCVVSRLSEPAEGWLRVRNALMRGRASARLLCPHSLEHLIETAAMTRERAIATDQLIRDLSLGWSLRLEPHLVVAQINALVRSMPLVDSSSLERTRFRSLAEPGVQEFFRQQKGEIDSFNLNAMAIQNGWSRCLGNGRRGDGAILDALVAVVNENYTRRFHAEIQRVLAGKEVEGGVGEGDRTGPREFSCIVMLLVNDHAFGEAELRMLSTRLEAEGVMVIPFYRTKVVLEACYLWKRKQITPSDQYDLTRIACALPVADLLITDGGAACAIRETGLDQYFETRVLSTRESERDGMISILTQWG